MTGIPDAGGGERQRRPPLHVDRLQSNRLYQEMIENSHRAAEAHERARFVVRVIGVVGLFFWTAVAVGVSSWGMGTVRFARYSLTIIEAGVLAGLAGILCTLLFVYQRLD